MLKLSSTLPSTGHRSLLLLVKLGVWLLVLWTASSFSPFSCEAVSSSSSVMSVSASSAGSSVLRIRSVLVSWLSSGSCCCVSRAYSDVYKRQMCTFLIINISSLQLIPVNVIAYRSQYGSVDPAAIVGAGILATTVSTAVAVVFCRLMDRRSKVS